MSTPFYYVAFTKVMMSFHSISAYWFSGNYMEYELQNTYCLDVFKVIYQNIIWEIV